jgi:hypothetical protein
MSFGSWFLSLSIGCAAVGFSAAACISANDVNFC